MRTATIWVLALWSAAAIAADTAHVQVGSDAGVYRITMSFAVAAPVSRVRAVLTDYAHLSRLNPVIKESQVLTPPEPGVVRVRTVVKACILFFCPKVVRVEDIAADGRGGLESEIVPAPSDLAYGSTHWSFASRGSGTGVSYHATMKPDFWIPPLIGPALTRSRIRKQLEITAQHIRRLATQAQPAT